MASARKVHGAGHLRGSEVLAFVFNPEAARRERGPYRRSLNCASAQAIKCGIRRNCRWRPTTNWVEVGTGKVPSKLWCHCARCSICGARRAASAADGHREIWFAGVIRAMVNRRPTGRRNRHPRRRPAGRGDRCVRRRSTSTRSGESTTRPSRLPSRVNAAPC